ncbi:hypothetical protein AAC387_Pa07g0407 [Persea americana]
MTLSLRLLPSRHCILSSASLPASSVIRRVRVSSSCKSTFSHQHFFKHVMSSSASSDTSSKAAAAAGGDPSPPPSNSGTGDGEENRESTDVLVQYVVLRRDLIDTWPLGSVVTQGCHASVAAIWSNRDDPLTLGYCSDRNLNSMHKATSLLLHSSLSLSLSLSEISFCFFLEMQFKLENHNDWEALIRKLIGDAGLTSWIYRVEQSKEFYDKLEESMVKDAVQFMKVTLEVKGESQILSLSEKLNEGGIEHKLWIEQPENIPTCLATKPYPKSAVSLFFRRLKLCK